MTTLTTQKIGQCSWFWRAACQYLAQSGYNLLLACSPGCVTQIQWQSLAWPVEALAGLASPPLWPWRSLVISSLVNTLSLTGPVSDPLIPLQFSILRPSYFRFPPPILLFSSLWLSSPLQGPRPMPPPSKALCDL